MAVKKVNGKKKVPIEKFIEAYQNPKFSKVSEVANYLGVKPSTISIRANKLKKGGVGLRDFPRTRESNIVEKARKILDSLKKVQK